MEKLTKQDGMSLKVVDENLKALKHIFPEAFSEDGIDFEMLRQLLGDEVAEGEEKYGLNWFGKKKARQIALSPSTATLRPNPEESVDWDTTQNLFIEGDNLEVLKLLQKIYSGKIKMIYIDPPYNTGKDFVYPDNYTDNLDTYLRYTGQRDAEGVRVSSNVEGSGRFHTNWLNMMYPRLKIARSLLSDKGIIFISINEKEHSNLMKVCFEIFGEENYFGDFIWNTEGNTDNQYAVKINHEYIVAFYKNSNFANEAVGFVVDPNTRKDSNLWKGFADNNINKNNPANPPAILELPVGFPSSEESLSYKAKIVDEKFFLQTKKDKYISDSVKEKYQIENLSGLPIKLDDMIVENYKLKQPCRIYVGMANREKLQEYISNGCQKIPDGEDTIEFYINSNAAVRYRKDKAKVRNILSVLRNFGTTERTKTYLRNLGIPYDYPKPVDLIRYLILIGCESDGTVLDFFAGSGTTAEAVLKQNSEDGHNRSYILVQLPELTDVSSQAYKSGYLTLSALCRKRLESIAFSDNDSSPQKKSKDRGFKSLKLASSNIIAWNPDKADLEQTLIGHMEHLVPGRSEQDVLYELLLKRGIELTAPIEKKEVAGKNVYSIGYGTLFACLDVKIQRDQIEKLAQGIIDWHKELDPVGETQVVFRDSAFENDVAKTNITAILEQGGIKHVRSL